MKRCTKGKSCGATCIDRSERCELELGPVISKSLTKARSRIGVVKLYEQARQHKVKGFAAKFNRIRGELKKEIGGQVRQTQDVLELKNRLQKEGLIPKTKKSEDDLGAIFAKQIAAGKEKTPEQPKLPSLPTDLKNQLFALPAPKTPQPSKGKGETDLIMDDISRLLRGSAPQNLQIASAGGEAGVRARVNPTEVRKVERQLESALGSKARPSMNVDQLREAAAREANELSLRRDKATAAAERKDLRARMDKLEAAIARADELNATATGNTRWARVEAKDHDDALGPVRREGSKSYEGWKDSYGSGATKIGEGSYGTVIKNPDGTFVKRGDISDTEAALIKRLGERDLGPKLVAADINGPGQYHKEKAVDIKNGRIAMGEVKGEPIGAAAGPGKQFNGKNAADVYWKSMAELHRMGIAHNDAHIDNILVDEKGKGRWVDMGLAQASPKAALAEAMGIFDTLKGIGNEAVRVRGAEGQGNWQARRWDGTGVRAAAAAQKAGGAKWQEFVQRFPVASKVWENRSGAQHKLMDMGLSRSDLSTIIDHGIRSPMSTYTKGPWAKLTDAQAQEVLNILYDGI
jgi:hypothetical protein